MTATAAHTDVPDTGDDFATEILRRRRSRLPALTAALALAVAIGAGIVGGIEIQKHWGSSTTAGASPTASARSALAARFGAAGGASAAGRGGFSGFGRSGGGFAGGGSAGGSTTTGTVTLIKGSTLYVTDSTGNTVLVKTTPTSRVTKIVGGTVQTVRPGDAVTVSGTQASDGSYTASSVAIANGANGG